MSNEKFALINVNIDGEEITKPVSVFLEKMSAGIGEAYAPWGKVRHAKADAEVARIENQALAENNELMERAVRRAVSEYMRDQKNIEAIIAQAAKLLPPDTPEETVRSMDEDKIAAMLGMFKTVSNQEMQLLWAKILVGEAAKPGSFSKRTAAVVSEMDKEDAELFAAFCQFVWTEKTYDGDFLIPMIFDVRHEVYRSQGITHNALVDLAAAGLISYDIAGMGSRYSSPATRVVREYFGTTVHLTPAKKKDGYYVSFGVASLTKHGEQLYPVCLSLGKVQKNDVFFQYIWEEWEKLGYNPSLTPPA